MKTTKRLVLSAVLFWCLTFQLAAFAPGDLVILKATHSAGVPVRHSPSDTSYFRWPNNTRASVVEHTDRWVKINSGIKTEWVHEKYVELEAAQEDGDEDEPITDIPSDVEAVTHSVGAWNLEHFKFGSKRGFPEFKEGIRVRTDADYQAIASAIRSQLALSIVALSEINGDGETAAPELEHLKFLLGGHWEYRIAKSGREQRVAFLWNTTRAKLKSAIHEIPFPTELVQEKDIFARDPLVGHFTLLDGNGAEQNDFLFVALHLASLQSLNENHNKAMEKLRIALHQHVDGTATLQSEKEILIAGDMNASRYDNYPENFWDNYDEVTTVNTKGFSFTTLAGRTAEDYRATRVVGRQPVPKSFIDYFLASKDLMNDIAVPSALVAWELAENDFMKYRLVYSDHFPIVVKIKISPDQD
jgi:endonuclease/exonuclease/phosphatase family metal-dependent hydrolase